MSLDVSIDLCLGEFDLRVAFGAGDGITALFGPARSSSGASSRR